MADFRILVTGSRGWTDVPAVYDALNRVLAEHPERSVVIVLGCLKVSNGHVLPDGHDPWLEPSAAESGYPDTLTGGLLLAEMPREALSQSLDSLPDVPDLTVPRVAEAVDRAGSHDVSEGLGVRSSGPGSDSRSTAARRSLPGRRS